MLLLKFAYGDTIDSLAILDIFLFLYFYGTIIRVGITCKKMFL